MFHFPAELINTLNHTQNITVLSGSGISAESGVPTFRDAQTGLWSRYLPEELASLDAFIKHPQLVLDWYTWRRQITASAQPNPGHLVLATIERKIENFHLITQNVDGLHQKAGSRSVIELHGNLSRSRCMEEGTIFETWIDELSPPRCPNCQAYLRPDVVWFGEALPSQAIEKALRSIESCDVFFSIGTSGVVYPAASFAWMALEMGKVVVEINLEVTDLTNQATYSFQGPAGTILPALVNKIWGEIGE